YAEEYAELRHRWLEPRLQRSFRSAGHARDLGELELLVDPQHHDLPQERGQTSQGRYDALGLLGPNGQKLRSRGQGRQLLGCLRLEVPHAVALPRQLAARQ